eukprot:CAMPEP_0119277230 /NCGR_PEP_ID=MMETSP1329-20130426/16779_1 /TAXON_ID=114041 /ORGANISM="Genus nov. species nov., Strain RCC1024" /LENGTH=264 /DNA_ID=CAMNT_0007277693 /DNA_START=82 /DNA_END=873 /DNA_ORIENTATION=-
MLRLTSLLRPATRGLSTSPASKPTLAAPAALRQVLEAGAKKKRRFDESVGLDVVLSLDPKKPLQQVRSLVDLPHGVGRSPVVAAFAQEPEEQAAATEAGAEVVGGDELVEKVAEGHVPFDACVATAAMVPALKRKAARVLGPRGLLPAPKNQGTVAAGAEELGALVAAAARGPVALRTEPKRGVLHVPFGKLSFGEEKLQANLRSLMHALVAAKPEKAPKGKYFLKASFSSTMGPGVPVDVVTLDPASPRFLRDAHESSVKVGG